MREIKFRAWFNASGEIGSAKEKWKMSRPFTLQEYGAVRADGVQHYEKGYLPNVASTKYCKLMQFTGLKDRNGKEVYEGDVCKANDGTVMAIEWHDGGLNFGYHNIELSYFIGYEQIEVIGNIYENPELLTDKE